MTTLERKSSLILVRKQCFFVGVDVFLRIGSEVLYAKFGEALFVGVQNTSTGF
jgi:hypothetical protein